MGPSLADIAVLSASNPLFAMLMPVGSPAIFFERLARYTNPLDCLDPKQPGHFE